MSVQLYPGMPFSPQAALTNNIGAGTASAAPSAPNPTTWPGRPVSASCLAARAANVPPEETGFSLPCTGVGAGGDRAAGQDG